MKSRPNFIISHIYLCEAILGLCDVWGHHSRLYWTRPPAEPAVYFVIVA